MSSSEDNNNNKRKRTSDGPEENDDISDRHKRDLVERYVKAFPPEQLTNILIDIVAQVPDAFEMLESYASNEVSHRKIFLRGIGPDTSQSLIKDFFTQFGAIEKAEIVVDKNTGKNKGFAFLLFQDINSVNNALASESYEIDGKLIYVNLAVLGKQFIESQNSLKDNNQNIDDVDKRKLFIRNLNPSTTVETLRTYFSMHGEIESCHIVMDKVTKRSKNYGFVIYKNSASAARALKEKNHIVDGKAAVVVLASEGTTKPIDPLFQQQQQQMMMAGYAFPGQQIAAVQQGYVYAPAGQMGYAAAGQTQHFQQPQHQLRNAGTHYQPTLTSNQTQKW